MEVLLLLTIFFEVHLVVGWNGNMQEFSEPGRTPKPPEDPLNPLTSPERKFFSMMRSPQRYPQGSPTRDWSPQSSADYWQMEEMEPSSSLQRTRANSLSGVASSGITVVAILAIVTILLKIFPYLFLDTSLSLPDLSSVLRAVLPAGMQVIPDFIYPRNTFTPKRPYEPPNYYSSGSRGLHSPYRRVENYGDYQE